MVTGQETIVSKIADNMLETGTRDLQHEFFTFPDGQIFPMVKRRDNHSALLHTFINSYNEGKKPVFLSQIMKLHEDNETREHRLREPKSKEKALSAIEVLKNTLTRGHINWYIRLLDTPLDVKINKDLDLSWTLTKEKNKPFLPKNANRYCVMLSDDKEFKAKSLFDQTLLEKSKPGTTLEELEEIFKDYNKEKSFSTDIVQEQVLNHIEKLDSELKKRDLWLSVCLRSAFEKPETKHPVQMIKIPTFSPAPEFLRR